MSRVQKWTMMSKCLFQSKRDEEEKMLNKSLEMGRKSERERKVEEEEEEEKKKKRKQEKDQDRKGGRRKSEKEIWRVVLDESVSKSKANYLI